MKRGKGFALVELMIVIEVVIFLLAMLLPALSKARQSARRAACINQLKQIITGIKTYSPDYDEYYPSSAAPGQAISVSEHYKDLGILYPTYVVSLDVFTCPSSGDKMPATRVRDRTTLVPDPGNPFTDEEARQVSYAYSYNGSGGDKVWTEAAPSTTRILADRHASKELTKESNHKEDGRNVAYQDGHVKWVSGREKLYTDPDNPDTKINTQCWWSERPDGPSKR
jgi:prepilin-type processing-associated H-X9-DG protein